MLCELCHGKHYLVQRGMTLPCPECGGLGLLHCCEGLQPDAETPHLPRGELELMRQQEGFIQKWLQHGAAMQV